MKLENENQENAFKGSEENQQRVKSYSGPLKPEEPKFTDSIGFKLIIITVLMVLLLLPASWIKDIIKERESLNIKAVNEVSEKWAGSQDLSGPIITVPIIYKKNKNKEVVYETKYWNILPQDLKIDGEVNPEKLNRGIYDVVVYRSNLKFNGNFDLDQKLDTTHVHEIQYNKAFVTLGISDLRGIKNQIDFKMNGKVYKIESGSRINPLISSGVTIKIPNVIDSSLKKLNYSYQLNLQGSKALNFVPLGGNTEVNLNSPWKDPSFKGNFIPDFREVSENGFTANWKVLALNKNFPQSFLGTGYAHKINSATFGVDLIVPLDDYQKSFRSVKYAVMTIALTFLIFFLIEILNKQKIHPLQYTLVGLALCLFYILLVAVSEHTNFNLAYGVSTFGIVSMISLYSLSIFKAKRMTWILISLLILIYSFLFVTLQLTDYALLMGSVGLVIILAATMFFTRKVDWYALKLESDTVEES